MIIFRYLWREAASTLLATISVLLVIFVLNQFVHYLNYAARGQISMTTVLQVMALQVPILSGYLLPLALFLGILLAYGRLYVDSEMTVMSACGVSNERVLAATLIFATLIMLIVAWLMLWAEPKTQWYRKTILTQAMATVSLNKIVPGQFQSVENGKYVIYAQSINKNTDVMQRVFLAQPLLKKPGWVILKAQQAYEKPAKDGLGNFLVFSHGYRYQGVVGQRDYQVVKYDHYGVRLVPVMGTVTDTVQYLPTAQLWQASKRSLTAAAELQWRLAMPISVYILAVLAMLLSRVNPRRGRFAQLFPGILIYIIYANCLFVGRSWIERGVVSPALGLWWVHGFMLALVLVLLFNQFGYWQLLRFRWRGAS